MEENRTEAREGTGRGGASGRNCGSAGAGRAGARGYKGSGSAVLGQVGNRAGGEPCVCVLPSLFQEPHEFPREYRRVPRVLLAVLPRVLFSASASQCAPRGDQCSCGQSACRVLGGRRLAEALLEITNSMNCRAYT